MAVGGDSASNDWQSSSANDIEECEVQEVSFARNDAAAPECLALCDDYAVWVTRHGALYLWCRQGGGPQLVSISSPSGNCLPFTPHLLCAHTSLLVLIGAWGVVSFAVEVHSDDELAVSLVQRFSARLALHDVIHGALSPDGSVVAMATPTRLVLMRAVEQDDDRNDTVPDEEGDDGVRVLCLDCSEWFGEAGCARTCVADDDRVFVLSTHNHLVAAEPDWAARTALLCCDGHVVTRVHHVVAMCCSRVEDGMLLLGLSDGVVKCLQMDTLEVFRSVDTLPALRQLVTAKTSVQEGRQPPSSTPRMGVASPAAVARHSTAHRSVLPGSYGTPPDGTNAVTATSLHAFVLDLAVGTTTLTVATPEAVLCFHKDSLTFEPGRSAALVDLRRCLAQGGCGVAPHTRQANTARLAETAAPVMAAWCARNGAWLAWWPLRGMLWYGAPPSGELRRADESENDDVVHACCPLPRDWLTPLETEPVRHDSRPAGLSRPARQVPPGRPVRQIRGSGYLTAPWSVQQGRKAAALKARKERERNGVASHAMAAASPQCRVLEPYDEHPLRLLHDTNRLLQEHDGGAPHTAALLSLTFSAAGDAVLSTSLDGSAFYRRLPVSQHRGEGVRLRGAAGGLRCAMTCADMTLALRHPLVLTGATCGAEKSDGGGHLGEGGALVQLWRPTQREAPLLTHRLARQGDVRAVRFYYMDKFIVYAHGPRVALCKYSVPGPLPSTGPDAARPGTITVVPEGPRIAAPVFFYEVTAHGVTAMDCVNHFTSNLWCVANTAKELHIVDVCAERAVRIVAEAHQRPIHHLCMSRGGRFVQATAADAGAAREHIVLTAALDGTVRAWDLRQSRPVRQFALHRNSALPTLGLALAPAADKIAVGSEDRSVYVYDIGIAGKPLDVLHCNEVPSAICWHPTDPLLTVGFTSGETIFYAQR